MAHTTLGLTCFPVWIPLWALGSFNMYLILSTLVSSTECWPHKCLSDEKEADEFSFSAECITWLFLCSAVCGCYAQSSLTLCNRRYCTLLDSSVRGIFQAWILEGVAISDSRVLPDPWIKPTSLVPPVFFITLPPGKPSCSWLLIICSVPN